MGLRESLNEAPAKEAAKVRLRELTEDMALLDFSNANDRAAARTIHKEAAALARTSGMPVPENLGRPIPNASTAIITTITVTRETIRAVWENVNDPGAEIRFSTPGGVAGPGQYSVHPLNLRSMLMVVAEMDGIYHAMGHRATDYYEGFPGKPLRDEDLLRHQEAHDDFASRLAGQKPAKPE